MKRCSSCKKEKEDVDFYQSKTKKDGLQNCCKLCNKSRCAQAYQKDPERYRKYSRWLYQQRKPERTAKKERASRVAQESEEIYAKTKEIRAAKYLYFIRCGRFVKIGVSKNVKDRIQDIQTHAPEPLELIACFPSMGNRELEFHKLFSHLRSSGEWFSYTDEIKKTIESLANSVI